jgi:hypothetical protein
MKRVYKYSMALILGITLSGCGEDGTTTQSSVTTIAEGETVTLSAGASISTYSGTCSPSITIQNDGSWLVTNTSTNGVCQVN